MEREQKAVDEYKEQFEREKKEALQGFEEFKQSSCAAQSKLK